MTFGIIQPSPTQPFSCIYEGIRFGRSYLKHQSAETPKWPQRGRSWGWWAHTRRWPYDPRSSPCQRSCLWGMNASGNAAYPMVLRNLEARNFGMNILVELLGTYHWLGSRMLFWTMKGSEGPCDDTIPGAEPDCWKRNSQTREGHPYLSISIFKYCEIYTIDKWLYSFKPSRTLVLCQFSRITTKSGITISDPRKLSLGKGMARALIYCKESNKEPHWRMMWMDKRSNDCALSMEII